MWVESFLLPFFEMDPFGDREQNAVGWLEYQQQWSKEKRSEPTLNAADAACGMRTNQAAIVFTMVLVQQHTRGVEGVYDGCTRA